MIEWKAVREAASQFLPKHTAAAALKHRNLSCVEQEGIPPMPKDRGAEQGDVDGPLECSFGHGGGSKAHVHCRGAGGGLADLRYMDDGYIMCHPIQVPSFLQETDGANAKVGVERNPLKTELRERPGCSASQVENW